MKIISFAWTTAPLLAGCKTMTWRDWDEDYAATFKPGELVQAWDRLPRAHGRRFGTIRIISVTKGTTADMLDEDYFNEGLGYLQNHPEAWPKTLFGRPFQREVCTWAYFCARRQDADPGFIVRFDWLGPENEPSKKHG